MNQKNNINLSERIFVAGGTGMVGSSIIRKLKERGYGLKQNMGEILSPDRKELNLLNINTVKDWFKKKDPTIVIIAAAKVGGIYANSKYPANFLLENLLIQNNLIQSAWEHGVKKLVFLGSSCIYPKYAQQPIQEESLLSGPLEPTNEWYAIAKISGIKLCQSLRIQYGFDAISLMPTNLYGPNDNYHPLNSHVIAALIRKFNMAVLSKEKSVICWGSGSPMREFLHVDDLSSAIIFCLEKWNPDLEILNDSISKKPNYFLNIGTGKEISIKDLAKKIANFTGYKGEIIWDNSKPDGTPRKLLDITKIKKLGWNYSINLDEGLKDTITQYKNHKLHK